MQAKAVSSQVTITAEENWGSSSFLKALSSKIQLPSKTREDNSSEKKCKIIQEKNGVHKVIGEKQEGGRLKVRKSAMCREVMKGKNRIKEGRQKREESTGNVP